MLPPAAEEHPASALAPAASRPRPTRAYGVTPRAAVTSAVVLLAVASWIWSVFAPAIMSYDSITQYRQAWTGQYTDWHPPVVALLLHLALRLGRNIGACMYVQVVLGLLGVQALAATWPGVWAATGTRRRPLVGLAAVAVLLLPLSPLPLLLMTFWKDSCAAVLFVWAAALAAALLEPADAGAPTRRATLARRAGFVLVIALLALVRHNAVVVLPVAALVLWLTAPGLRAWRRVALALLPALLFLAADAAIVRGLHVRQEHMERHLMASDLAGLAARQPGALATLHYLAPYLLVPLDEVRARYQPGVIQPGVWSPAALGDGAALRREYLRAWTRYPRQLLAIKLQAFVGALGFPAPHLFVYYPQIDPNEFGLKPRPQHAALRAAWGARTVAIGTHAVWRFVFGEHWVWVAIGLGWLAAALRSRRRRALALVLALPLAYHFAYLLAAPANDYRLMYPATLVVQCVTVAWLLDRLAARISLRRRRA